MIIIVINIFIEVLFIIFLEIVIFFKKILIMIIMMIGKKDFGEKGRKD